MKDDKLDPIIQRIHDSYFRRIDCGPGWMQLILDCHEELVKIDPDYEVLQIKEKFGGLRYYAEPKDPGDTETWEKMREVIRRYESLSYVICELTGGPGTLMKNKSGQLKTMNPSAAPPDWEQIRVYSYDPDSSEEQS